ncbi:MAG: helix-turn-helix transcriptional regulator [Alphaproteobacteria bacterium]|nr:helix-turn-helix transcriptional regulator [Alphaproteobacteria bacterium]
MKIINYDKLWKMLKDKKMKKTDLQQQTGLSWTVISKMSKWNEPVSMEVLVRICRALKCDIGDVIELNKDDFTDD